jgi:hypothetical protein
MLVLLAAVPCGAQVPPEVPADAATPGSGIVPLSLVLEALQAGAGIWRPDWPAEIPPDAFAVAGALSVELEFEAAEAELAPRPVLERYRLARDPQGRLGELPLVLYLGDPAPGPLLAQARLHYAEGGGITAIDLEIPPLSATPLSIHFDSPYVGQDQSFPLIRVEYGETPYYVVVRAGINEIAETWFDPWGVFSAYITSRIAPSPGSLPWRILGLEGAEYGREDSGALIPRKLFGASLHYESGGHMSESSGDYGSFSAIYGDRPLSWSRNSRNFSLQWDEEGRLVRLRELTTEAPELPVDFRYDYEVDSRGNWVRRRETALLRAGNLLLPVYSRDLVRRIVYAGGEGDGGLD